MKTSKPDKKRPYLQHLQSSWTIDPVSGYSCLVILHEGRMYFALNVPNPGQGGKWPELSRMQIFERARDLELFPPFDSRATDLVARAQVVAMLNCPKCTKKQLHK